MEAKNKCATKATTFFYNADTIRAAATHVVSDEWDDYVVTRLSCSLPVGHNGDHAAYYEHDLSQEELLSWPQFRSPLDPFQGV